jgi:hypothetical protein
MRADDGSDSTTHYKAESLILLNMQPTLIYVVQSTKTEVLVLTVLLRFG